MVIYSIKNNRKTEVPITKESKRTFTLMSADNINLTFSLNTAERFEIGDYVFYNGNKYELTTVPTPTYNTSTGGYDYQLSFEAEYYKWKNKIFKYTPEIGGQEAEWTLTENAEKFLQIIVRNLEHLGYRKSVEDGEGIPYSYDVDETVERKMKNISFSNTSILDALTNIAKEWECDWWIDGNIIRMGAVEHTFRNTADNAVEYRVGENLANVSRNDTKTLATRIYPFGSTKNIPYTYRKHLMFDVHKEQQGGVWHITDASRPLEPEWFDKSSWDKAENRYENTSPMTRDIEVNSSAYPNTWSDNIANCVLFGSGIGETPLVQITSDKCGAFSLGYDNGSGESHITYTFDNIEFKRLYVDIKAGSSRMVTFRPTIASLKLVAVADYYGNPNDKVRSEVVISNEDGKDNITTTVNKNSGTVTVKVKLPKATPLVIDIKKDAVGKNLSVSHFAIPSLGLVDDSGKTSEEYDKDDNLRFLTFASNTKELSFKNIRKYSYRYAYKAYLSQTDFFPMITNSVQFFVIEDHRYVPVGEPYECRINESRDATHISDIRLFAEPPKDTENPSRPFFFKVLGLQEYKVKPYYFRSDAFLYDGNDDYVLNGIAKRNLMLPVDYREFDESGNPIKDKDYFDKPYLDSEPNLPQEQYVEQVVVFDDVFPRTRSKITKVASTVDYVTNQDDESTSAVYTYYFQCGWEKLVGCDEYGNEQYEAAESFKFSKDYILEAQTLEITFMSGKMNGMTFEVTYHGDAADLVGVNGLDSGQPAWEIVRNETYGITLPGDVLLPSKDDTFVLTGWDSAAIKDMGLIDAAEEELLVKARLWLDDKMKDPSNYTCTLMCDYAYEEIRNYGSFEAAYQLGSLANIYSDAFFGADGHRQTHIIGWEYPLDYPYDNPKITLGETPTTSRLSTIEGKVDAIIKNGVGVGGSSVGGTSGGGASVYLIKRGDKTLPLDTNTFSAQRIVQDFLRKNEEDVAMARMTFAKGISVGLSSYGFDENGNVAARTIGADTVTAQSLSSPNYAGGQLGAGYKIGQGADGKSFMEIDNLLVRYAAQFTQITFNNLEFIAGNRVLSAAGGEIAAVQPLYDNDNVVAYKCFLNLTDRDGRVVAKNYWALGDQARCQSEDNPVSGGKWQTQGYWRRVIEVGEDYIVLSNQEGDYDATMSSGPRGGDKIVQLGNGGYTDLYGTRHGADTDRQNAIMFEVVGEDAPSIKQYKNIDSFELDSRLVTKISPSGNEFTGKFHVSVGDDNKPLRVEVRSSEVFFMTTADFVQPQEDAEGWKADITDVDISNATPYLWKKTIYHYNDGDDTVVEFVSKSQRGADGSVVIAEEQYYTSTTIYAMPEAPEGSSENGSIIAPNSGAVWYTNLNDVPYDEENKYLWRYTMTFFSVDEDRKPDGQPSFVANIELLSVYGEHGVNGVGSLFLELSRNVGVVGLDPETKFPLPDSASFKEVVSAKYGTENAVIKTLHLTVKSKGKEYTYNISNDGSLAGRYDVGSVSCTTKGHTKEVTVDFWFNQAHDSGSLATLTFAADVSFDDDVNDIHVTDTISKTIDISFSAGGAKGDDGEPTHSLQLVTSNLEGLTPTVGSKEYIPAINPYLNWFSLPRNATAQVRAMSGSVNAEIVANSVEVAIDGVKIINAATRQLCSFSVQDNIISLSLAQVPYSPRMQTIGGKTVVFPKTNGNIVVSCSVVGKESNVPLTISIPFSVDYAAKFGEYEMGNERFRTELLEITNGQNANISRIEQTARNISLKVGERNDYRNIIPNSHFEQWIYKYGDLRRSFRLKKGKYLFTVKGLITEALYNSERYSNTSTTSRLERQDGCVVCYIYNSGWTNQCNVTIRQVSSTTASVFLDVELEDDYSFAAFVAGAYKKPVTYADNGNINGTLAENINETAYVEWAMLEDVTDIYEKWTESNNDTPPNAAELFDGWTDSNIGKELLDTGIDIEKKKITLTSDTVEFKDNQGNLQALISGNTISAAVLESASPDGKRKTEISYGLAIFSMGNGQVIIGVDADGNPCLKGVDNEGKVIWEFGKAQYTPVVTHFFQARILGNFLATFHASQVIWKGSLPTIRYVEDIVIKCTVEIESSSDTVKSEYVNITLDTPIGKLDDDLGLVELSSGATKTQEYELTINKANYPTLFDDLASEIERNWNQNYNSGKSVSVNVYSGSKQGNKVNIASQSISVGFSPKKGQEPIVH